MEIKINVDEETFFEIKNGKKNDIEIWKTKFKSNLSAYDKINIIKWQTNDILTYPVRNILIEPNNTKYKVLFGEEKQNLFKQNVCLFLFFLAFLLSFFITINYQTEVEDLRSEVTTLQIKNDHLERRMRVCLYE